MLYEYPLKALDLFLPPWVDALPQEHPIKAAVFAAKALGTEDQGATAGMLLVQGLYDGIVK